MTTPKPWDDVSGKWNRTAPWRQAVQRRRAMLIDELKALDENKLDVQKKAQRDYLQRLIGDANEASRERAWLWKWWWGTEIERAWAGLREVEERIPALLPDDDIALRMPDAAAHGAFYLDRLDSRVVRLNRLEVVHSVDKAKAPAADIRSAIIDVLRAAHAQADRVNQEARHLRNRLLVASALSFVFEALLVAAQACFGDVHFISIPQDLAPVQAWKFVVIVMLFGAIGALFTAIPAMSKVPSDYGPFNLPLQQALLKIAFGPLAAFIGLTIVRSDFVNTSPHSWLALLTIATVFGAGQQVVTAYVDRRAREVLTATAHSG